MGQELDPRERGRPGSAAKIPNEVDEAAAKVSVAGKNGNG